MIVKAARQLVFLIASAVILPYLSLAATSSDFQLTVLVHDYQASWLNSLDTHEWLAPDYADIFNTILFYKEKAGRRSLGATFTINNGGGTWSVIRVNEFIDPEDWSDVNQVKCDVYIETTSSNNKTIELELKNVADSQIQKPVATITNKNTWVEASWNVATGSNLVSAVFLTPNAIEDGEKYYFSNLRLVRGGSEEQWDPMDVPTYFWSGSGDFAAWKSDWGRNEPITNNQTYNNSSGALSIPWNAAIDAGQDYAKMEATKLQGFDFTPIQRFRVNVYSDRAGLKLRLDFWDGANYGMTTEEDITTVNGWQTITWNKPTSTMNWGSLNALIFMVNTAVGGSGQVYLDEIEFLED